MKHDAEINYTSEENEDGREQECVYATCCKSDITIGPIWGQSDASVKRALATLSEECEGFHVAED